MKRSACVRKATDEDSWKAPRFGKFSKKLAREMSNQVAPRFYCYISFTVRSVRLLCVSSLGNKHAFLTGVAVGEGGWTLHERKGWANEGILYPCRVGTSGNFMVFCRGSDGTIGDLESAE